MAGGFQAPKAKRALLSQIKIPALCLQRCPDMDTMETAVSSFVLFLLMSANQKWIVSEYGDSTLFIYFYKFTDISTI